MSVAAVKTACWAISLPWSQVIEALTARGRSATMACKAVVTVWESWPAPRRLGCVVFLGLGEFFFP